MALARILLVALFVCSLFINNAEGTITVSPVTVDEEAGTATVTVHNDLAQPAGAWGFTWETADGTAIAGSDFIAVLARNEIVIWPTDTIDLSISIVDDNDFDPGETFTVALTAFFGAEPNRNVVVTITDNERIPLNLTQPSAITKREGTGNVSLTLTLDSAAPYDFNATVGTMDGTATAPDDYATVTDKHVSFSAGDTTVTLTDLIYINDDALAEPSETFDIIIYSVDLAGNYTAVVTIEDDDTPVNSHCKRQGQTCLNGGTCDDTSGMCACPADRTGPNCAHLIADLQTSCDNSTCVHGICLTGSPAACVCNPGYAGAMCDNKAYYHQCNPNNISVCITPFSHDTFVGKIYVQGMKDTVGCNLTLAPNTTDPSDGIADWCQGYAGIFEYNGTCGELGPIPEGDLKKYELKLDVRYSPGIRKSTDEEVTFKCTFNDAEVVVDSPAQAINTGSSGGGTKNGGSDTLTPAAQTVVTANGDAILGPVTAGDPLQTCVTVQGLDNFNGIVIKNITINNNRTAPDYREMLVYDTRCDVSGAGLVTTLPAYKPPTEKHTLCFMLESFTFEHDDGLTNPALGIVSVVQVFGLAADANQPSCVRRRKRNAEGTNATPSGISQEEELTSVVYLVRSKTLQSTSSQETTCAKEWLLPAMIGLGIVTITMAVVIIVLVYTVIRQFKGKQIA
ncbi:uncharacterized protein [Haliotis cracherodii]|uniref:uncharacterized protein n=1 Tax=Haliotis cracherodii TaxID=6455 RepID=UPI0039EA8DFB